MNKNIVIKLLIVLGVFLIIGIGLYIFLDDDITKDERAFKNEYENLNGQKNENGRTNIEVEIPKDNNIKYASSDEVMKFLDEGTGILYLGFPKCPWCRNIVPTLLETAKENEIEDIYYFNALSIRDEKKLDEDGNIITTKKGTKAYYKLVDRLKDQLTPYEGLNDESIKRLYFPTVIFVQSGKIVGSHIGSVDSQENPYKPLTKQQKKELKSIYTNNINKIYGTCDENC